MKVMFLCGYLHEGIAFYFQREEQYIGGWIKGFLDGIRPYEDLAISFAAFEEADQNNLQTEIINHITYYLVSFKDESDRKFYEVAKFYGVPLVTENVKHFPQDDNLMTVAEYYAQLIDR